MWGGGSTPGKGAASGRGRQGHSPSRTGSPCWLVTPLLEMNVPRQASLPWGHQEPTARVWAPYPCREAARGCCPRGDVHSTSAKRGAEASPHPVWLSYVSSPRPPSPVALGDPVRLVGSAAPPGTHSTSVGHVLSHMVTPQLPLEGRLMCAELGPPPPTIRPSGVSASEPLSRPLPGVSLSLHLSVSLSS